MAQPMNPAPFAQPRLLEAQKINEIVKGEGFLGPYTPPDSGIVEWRRQNY
jgi:hypothetical protein